MDFIGGIVAILLRLLKTMYALLEPFPGAPSNSPFWATSLNLPNGKNSPDLQCGS